MSTVIANENRTRSLPQRQTLHSLTDVLTQYRDLVKSLERMNILEEENQTLVRRLRITADLPSIEIHEYSDVVQILQRYSEDHSELGRGSYNQVQTKVGPAFRSGTATVGPVEAFDERMGTLKCWIS